MSSLLSKQFLLPDSFFLMSIPQNQEYIVAGQGVPVVLLHSSMTNKDQWFKLIQLLKPSYKVIAIDLYGYGSAPYPVTPSSFSLLDESARIHEIIVGLIGDLPFHLIGHSYGGATALRLTCDHEHLVKSLSCFEPVAFHLLDKDNLLFISMETLANALAEELEQQNPAKAARLFVDYWSGEGTYDSLNSVRQAALTRAIGKVKLDFQAIINDPRTLQDYTNMKIPCCFISGKQSRDATKKIVQMLAKNLPCAELKEIEGSHMAPVAQAETVNDIWVSFLQSAENKRPRDISNDT